MPSNAYIHFVAKSIPDNIRKHMIEQFSISEDLADLYMGLLMCTVCSMHTRSIWRTQLNTMFVGACEHMFRKGDITDFIQFDARVPHEVNHYRWLPSVINEFGNYAEESCMVVNRLLEDRLIRMIPNYRRAG